MERNAIFFSSEKGDIVFFAGFSEKNRNKLKIGINRFINVYALKFIDLLRIFLLFFSSSKESDYQIGKLAVFS